MPLTLALLLAVAQVLTRPPELLEEVPAVYPAEAAAQGTTATVLLELEIGVDGTVTRAGVVESGGAPFDAAALDAARRFRFRPAEVDGAPAPVRIQYRTTFRLAEVAAPPRAPRLSGRVRDRWSKAPLAGVRVTAGTRTTSTSTTGALRLDDLEPGPITLALAADGYQAMRTEEALVAGEETHVEYLLEPLTEAVDDEEVVRAPRLHKRVTQVVLAAAEARRVPGTQGDTVKVVQTMPGVARPPVGSGAISVWGAAPEETRVFLDGVEIPALYHLGGIRSVIASELVERVALTPAGQGAAFGRGVGGVVEVETRRLDTDGLHGALALDLLDVGAWVTARPSERTRVAVAGRQSLLHAIVPALTDRDVGDLFPLPDYRDLALAADLDLGAGEHLDVRVLGSMDTIDRAVVGEARAQADARDFVLARARWERTAQDERTRVVPAVSWSRRARAITADRVTASEEVHELRGSVRAEHHQRLAEGVSLTLGLDAVVARTELARRGSLTIPAREGDPAVFGRAPGDAINADDWATTTLDLAPYASADIALGPVTLTPGLRVDLLGLGVSRLTPKLALTPEIGGARLEPRIGPRLAAAWDIVPELLRLRGAVGLYHQPAEPEATSAVFGNPVLAVAEGTHATVAVESTLGGRVHLELAGFVRAASGLVARTTLETPKLAEALTSEGEGRAAGGQALVRIDAPARGDGPFGWVSYTALESERRATPTSAWRPADFDRTHALSAVAGYLLGPWSLGARLRWTSGAPTTAVIGRSYDARRDLYVPRLGETNGATLPAFFQLDLRAERAFDLEPVRLLVSLELQNVTAHDNVEALAYRSDYLESRPVTGLPWMAIAGLRVEL